MTDPRLPVWAALVTTVMVVLIGAICSVNGASRIGRPFPGFLVAHNRTVLSIGREGWSVDRAARAPFAQVVALDGRPLTHSVEIQERMADLAEGTPVSVRLRKGGDVFTATVEVQSFSSVDFLAIYGTYAALGLFFAVSGLVAFLRERRRGPPRPASLAFFLVCQSAGLTFATAGDVYGPYWFTPVYFTAQCLVVASMLHLAASFPHPLGGRSMWRRLALALVYLAMIGLAVALHATGSDLSLFLPLVYVLYLLLANAIILWVARLAIGLSLPASAELRAALRWALSGVLLVVLGPVMIFLVYPALEGTISPLVLVGPFAFFPLCTARALRATPGEADRRAATSVRLRLTLLFLGAVETSFLIAVAVFWQSQSWAQLLAERTWNQRQVALVERVAAGTGPASPADLALLDHLAQTVEEDEMARAVGAAVEAGDLAEMRARPGDLADLYAGAAARLEGRQSWIGGLNTGALATLLAIAILQAVAFTIAVRRWLVAPIDRISAATQVIATGDLGHRIELDASEELAALAGSVNAMATSLQSINRRVEAVRAARQRAAGTARDAERRRLARELHDGILQDLSAIRLRLEVERTPGDSVEAIAAIIAAIRRVVDDLRPSGLGELSLEQAIAGHVRILAFAQGVRLSLDLTGAASVPDWAVRDVYRIAQEASANALRHAHPTHLAVRLFQHGEETVLEIEDDGSGFAADSVAFGSGLHGMRDRAAALGGDLDIRSGVGRGSTVRLVLRFPQTAA